MKSKSSNRTFGLLFFTIFIIFGLWPLKNGENINSYLIIISLIFLVLGLLNSKILSPLNNAWIKFGIVLGTVIAPIVMGVVYFIILTPLSLIFVRLFRKDLLSIKFDKNKKTYWIKRDKNINSMNKQY